MIEVMAALEEEFGVTFADDDVNETTFGTIGALAAFVDGQLS